MRKLTVTGMVGCARSSSYVALGALALALAVGQPAAAQEPSAAPAQQPANTPDNPGAPDDLKAGTVPVPPPPPNAQLPVVEPVLPDDEFNSAIPALDAGDDPELDRPLESIAEFERRIAAEQAKANPTEGQAPPVGDPALADQDAVEEIGDAPIRDAELNKPLPPIDQFQVEPVQFAEEEADAEDAEVRYTIQVNGLDSADKETEVALSDMFKDLSALHDGDGKAANAAMVTARLTEDSGLLKRILGSEGWFEPRVRTRIERGADEKRPALAAIIDVTPGKRYNFTSITAKADPTVPPGLIEKSLALKVGEPIVAQRVQGAEAQVAVVLPQEGYPFAEVGQRDILLDRQTGGGDYTLPVTTGPRARYGDIATQGDLAFDAKHVEVLTRFKRGELYDSRKIDDLRQALVATGLFSTVSAEPQRTGQAVGDGTEYVTVMVNQDAGPPRTIAGTAGYGTGQGFRLEGSWTHRNLFPPEGALIVHGVAGTQEFGLGTTFRRANAGQRDRTFELTAEALRSDYEAYDAYTGRLAARISRDSTPIWQKKFTYAAGIELLASGEKDYNFATGTRERRTFYIGGLSGQVGFDTSDDLLNPTKGFRLTALVQPEGSLEGGFTPYVRARLDGSAYYSVSDDIVLAGRLRFGTIQGAERGNIAPSRRFYAGGGGSVRGFGYQELGPRDPDGDPLGGRSVNEGAAEVRYRFGNFGVVGFVDVGQAYESTMPKFSNLRYGVGIGGRFYTNFGPFRLDVATPINRQEGEAKIAVYVSIGQAF